MITETLEDVRKNKNPGLFEKYGLRVALEICICKCTVYVQFMYK